MNRKHKKRSQILNLLKQSMTTKGDLELLANKLNLDVKIVWLKDADPKYKGAQIINLGNPIIGGTHYVCSYNGMYFDPFGMVSPEKLDHLQWVPLQIQNMNYGHCGQYCVLWLYYAKMNEIDKFYNLLETLN
jgi:hypothetical protein